MIADFSTADETICVSVHKGVDSSEKEKKLRRIIFDNDGNEPHFVKKLTALRQMMIEVGGKRGRPLLLSIRVPDSLDYCRAIGLDAQHWLENGLLDLMVVTSYFQLTDWSETAAIGEKYDIPVYTSLDEARSKDVAVIELRSSLLAYRGRAAAALGAGIDGIQLFNFFDPNEPHWNELGDQTSLLNMDKDYFGSVRGMGVSNGGTLPYTDNLTVETLRPDSPKVIGGTSETIAKIRLGPMKPTGVKATLRLRFSSIVESLDISLDGKQIEIRKVDSEWMEADLGIETFGLITPQLHLVKVMRSDQGKPIQWLDVMVQERHGIPKVDKKLKEEKGS